MIRAAKNADTVASTRNEAATSEPTAKADSSQTAKAKKAAAKDSKLATKDTTVAQSDVPTIDVQGATPAALPEREDPMNAAAAPSTDTSAAAASADKPVESTAESQAAAAPVSASADPVAPTPAPSDKPSPSVAVASTTDTKQAGPEAVVPASPPKGAAPAADAEASWDFGDGGSDTQKDAAASDSPELFEDAVHVQVGSDSDDDKPLAQLPSKKKTSAAAESASKPPADTQSKPVPATNSTTGDVAATEGAKVAAEIKNADSVAASAEPTPAPNSSKDAPAPNADAANELAKENATPAEPATTADIPAPAGQSKVDSTQPEQPTSEQPSTIVETGSGPDVKSDEPKEAAKPSDADAKTENVTKKYSDSTQAAKQEDKDSTKKPELHINLKDGAPSAATEPTEDSSMPLPTPDVEGGVQSSLPKHMQDADEGGVTTEGSEQDSRPASPMAQKNAAGGGANQPKTKRNRKAKNKK
ncbi:hypothetical protein BC629DRAFT_431509 [Irpex lacteus]|nr:hypothetical protein BC629DRAFT_431509 [Irpex lacteus]